jgi:hypothetical protein
MRSKPPATDREENEMNRSWKIAAAGLLGLIALGTGVTVASSWWQSRNSSPPPIPALTAGGGVELCFAQPYQLDEPYTHWWRAERPQVSSGILLVLAVDPDLVHPRQGFQPVLYVGNQTAERINVGFVPGEIAPGAKAHVVALVPAERDPRGRLDLDLSRTPIWFGTPALPEEVDEQQILAEYALARTQGLQPPTPAAIRSALSKGGGTVFLPDYHALQQHATALIGRYSPGERDLIDGLLAPPPENARIIR